MNGFSEKHTSLCLPTVLAYSNWCSSLCCCFVLADLEEPRCFERVKLARMQDDQN